MYNGAYLDESFEKQFAFYQTMQGFCSILPLPVFPLETGGVPRDQVPGVQTSQHDVGLLT